MDKILSSPAGPVCSVTMQHERTLHTLKTEPSAIFLSPSLSLLVSAFLGIENQNEK